jgi:uncharacterized membrane protein YfcA
MIAAMPPWWHVLLAGSVVGLLMGLFGVGGSSVATPLLSLLGVPPLVAVASPLPATIPGAIVAAIEYIRNDEVRPRAAAWTLAGAVPATIVGALTSRVVGGNPLLIASGVVLAVVGLRVGRPIEPSARTAGELRRKNRPVLVGASALVGFFTGLLANGGGFLLVPLYVLVFGLRMRQSVGTSLIVIAVLAVPTLATHWELGHISWEVAGAFAGGVVPGSFIGGRVAHRIEGPTLRKYFGWFLIAFGVAFVAYRLTRTFT